MNQGDKEYFKHREGKGHFHLNIYTPEIIIPRIKAIIEELGLEKGSSVFDFGCAKGFYIRGFEELGLRAVGYDISEHAVSKANEFLGKELAFNDLSKVEELIKSSKEKFELVLMKDTAEHISESDLENIFNQLREIAKQVLVIVPLKEKYGKECPDLYKDPTHINMQSDNKWLEFLNKFGSAKDLEKLNKDIKGHIKKEYADICGTFLLEF